MAQLFGDKLRRLRHVRGMTQGELAEQLSLASYTHITKIEAGQRAASLAVIIRSAYVFDVAIDDLLRDSTPASAIRRWPIETAPRSGALMQHFAPKLRALRTGQHISQIDLAQQLGLARQAYISNLEAGRKAPSPELVLRIADLFGVTADDLLRDEITIAGM